MATQTIQFGFLTGKSVTVKLFADDGSDTVLDTPTATEATNRTGVYSFTQTDRAAGTYLLTVSATGINAAYSVTLTLTTGTFWAYEQTASQVVGDPKLSAIYNKLPLRDYLTGTDVNSGAIAAADRAAISDAVHDDLLEEHTTPGTSGWAMSAIKAKTDNLPSDPADQSAVEAAITAATSGLATTAALTTVDTVVDAIKLKTDLIPSDIGSVIVSTNSNREVLVTGSNHIAADVHEIQSAVVTTIQSGLATASSIVTLTTKVDTLDDYVDTEVAAIKAKTDNLPADPADASDIAASFVTVNTKLDAIDDYVDTEVASIKVVTDRLSDMLVQDGAVYQYTTNALERAPSGGSGGTVAVYPLNATMPARVYDLNITFYKNEDGTVVGPVAVTSRNANVFEPVDLSGRTLSVRFVDYTGTELLTVDNGDITVSGADNNQISFPVTSAVTGEVTESPQDQWHIWTLHDLTSGDNVLIGGKARVLLC